MPFGMYCLSKPFVFSLLNIHNETITSIMGWQPSQEQASAFVSNARDVLKLMEPYMKVGYKSKASSPKD